LEYPKLDVMELKQLEYFVQIAQIGSFSKAAIVLSVAQPALSKQIRRLEVELHRSLFNRNGRGVSLTDDGSLFLDHAREILDQVSRARNALGSRRGPTVGKVVMATPPSTGKSMTQHLLSAFRARFPDAKLEIIEERSRSVYELLMMGRIDIGVLYDFSPSSRLEAATLREDALYLVSPASRASSPKLKQVNFRDLEKYPLILPGLYHATRTLVEMEAANAGMKLNVVQEIEGSSLILPLVERGYGHAILLGSSLDRNGPHRALRRSAIVRPTLKRVLTVAIMAQRPVSRLTRETVSLIRQHFGAASGEKTPVTLRLPMES